MSIQSFTYINIFICIIFVICFFLFFFRIEFNAFRRSLIKSIIQKLQRKIKRKEDELERQLFLNDTHKLSYKYYYFLNNIKIDIPVLDNIPLYLFNIVIQFATLLLAVFANLILSQTITPLVLFLYPVIFFILVSSLFSITINERYQRLIDCINTENLLCINITSKFYITVKDNLNNIPVSIRKHYERYLTQVLVLNNSEREAINKLNLSLGGYSNDFLKNIIIYITNPVNGFINTFKDIIEINNKRMSIRQDMEKAIDDIKTDFSVSFILSFGLYFICFILLTVFRDFYLHNVYGQILLIINLLLLFVIRFIFNLFRSKNI